MIGVMSEAIPRNGSEVDAAGKSLKWGNGWRLTGEMVSTLTQTIEQALSDPVRLREGVGSYRIIAAKINSERLAVFFTEVLNTVYV